MKVAPQVPHRHPAAPSPLCPQGCSFSSNSPSIGERRGAGARGRGSGAAGLGHGRGKGPCRAVQPRRCESADISYRPCSNFPCSPAVCAAGGEVLRSAPGLGEELLPGHSLAPEPRSLLGTGGCPATLTAFPSTQHPIQHPSRHPMQEEEEKGGTGGGEGGT